jgi:hypothetical protein
MSACALAALVVFARSLRHLDELSVGRDGGADLVMMEHHSLFVLHAP